MNEMTMFEAEQSREAKEDAALARIFNAATGIASLTPQEYMELAFTLRAPGEAYKKK